MYYCQSQKSEVNSSDRTGVNLAWAFTLLYSHSEQSRDFLHFNRKTEMKKKLKIWLPLVVSPDSWEWRSDESLSCWVRACVCVWNQVCQQLAEESRVGPMHLQVSQCVFDLASECKGENQWSHQLMWTRSFQMSSFRSLWAKLQFYDLPELTQYLISVLHT